MSSSFPRPRFELTRKLDRLTRATQTIGWRIKRAWLLFEAVLDLIVGCSLVMVGGIMLCQTDQALSLSAHTHLVGQLWVSNERAFFLALLVGGIAAAQYGFKEVRAWFHPVAN